MTNRFHCRAKECRRYAIALGVMCGACAFGFVSIDRPALTGVAGLLPLLLASGGFATALGCVNELREAAWWRRLGELEAAWRPVGRAWDDGREASGKYEEGSRAVVGGDASSL